VLAALVGEVDFEAISEDDELISLWFTVSPAEVEVSATAASSVSGSRSAPLKSYES
jgi:hypothetical protein